MTDAQVSVAAEIYEQGLSSAAIGQKLGFDNHTILNALRSRGVKIRIRPSRKSDVRGR